MADINSSATLKNQLISYWDMEESNPAPTTTDVDRVDKYSTNNLVDQSATPSGTMSGVGDGVAADFDRSSNDRFIANQVGNSLNIGALTPDDISISFWADGFDVASQLILKRNDGTDGYIFELGGGSAPLKIIIEDNNQKSEAFTDDGAGTGKNHWVITCDVSGPTTVIYKNGDVADSTQNTSNATAIGSVSTPFLVSQSGGEGLDGKMKFLGIWHRELTSGEVTELYNDGAGLPYEAAEVGPATLKTLDTIDKANIATINDVAIASVKTINTAI